MDNMGKEYRNILNNIEERLKGNPELEYVKSEFTNLFMLFFNEIDNLRELYEEKIETILDRQSYFDEKLSNLQDKTSNLEKEISENTDNMTLSNSLNSNEALEDFEFENKKFKDIAHEENESEKYDFEDAEAEDCEIVCPYCNETFELNEELLEDEIECPYCKNPIEIDWED